jgi:hypothetical protein
LGDARGDSRRPAPRWLRAALFAGAVGLCAGELSAQRGARFPRGDMSYGSALGGDFFMPRWFNGNPPYDGRVTFARVKYRGYGYGAGWAHDYPTAEVNFMTVLREVTSIRPFREAGPIMGGAIVALDDPTLLKYPVAYLSEPGGWFPTAAEALGLRNYLQKGGFLLVDDFPYDALGTFLAAMQKAMPELRPVRLTGTEAIFDSFFKVDLDRVRMGVSGGGGRARDAQFLGYYERNDPQRRLVAFAAYGLDIGDSWEWSGRGFMPVDVTNEAFKVGVNYIIYALTH